MIHCLGVELFNPLTQNIVWQLHAKDLRRDMSAWSDQRLADFEAGFKHWDHNIARAYLEQVSQEKQRRSSTG